MSREILLAIRDDARAAEASVEALLARLESALAAGGPDVALAPEKAAPELSGGLAWGAKVSPTFRERVRWIAADLELDPDDLMACMAWESGRSFRPDVKNMAGSGATGLIQFMPSTARGLGTSVEALAEMTAEDQLNFVWKYFAPQKGRLKSLADVYMCILWPKAVGKPDDYALFTGGVAYRQNAGLDTDKDGKVTKREAARKVMGLLEEGRRPGNIG